MKKIMLSVSILILSALISCTTMVPVSTNNYFPSDGNYEILGRVTVTTNRKKSGYLKLLDEAQKKYPKTDEIVNIMVDAKRTTLFLFFHHYTYTMTALAIDIDNM